MLMRMSVGWASYAGKAPTGAALPGPWRVSVLVT